MGKPTAFSFVQRKNGDVVISHHQRTATVLRGRKAATFLARLADGDDQELMARATGNYKRGNERR
jgi:hypothetical protein